MVNSWIADEFAQAHADLLAAGLADVCTFRPKVGDPVPNCQAYFDFDQITAAQLGVQITKDQILVRLLMKTTDGIAIAPVPKNGDEIETDDFKVIIATRLKTDEDSWSLVCQL